MCSSCWILAFVQMRRLIADNTLILNRLDRVERKQLEADKQFEIILDELAAKKPNHDKGIFYDGQVFDTYIFVADIIRKASSSVILVDNYVDDTVLHLFTKRKKGVSVTIYTKAISKVLALDLEKYNSQYAPIAVRKFEASHDRFLILDEAIVCHIGASLKNLGKNGALLDLTVIGLKKCQLSSWTTPSIGATTDSWFCLSTPNTNFFKQLVGFVCSCTKLIL